MRYRLFLILFIVLLGGCLSKPAVFSDVHTGQFGYRSGQMLAHWDYPNEVRAFATYSEHSGAFAIDIEFRTFEGRYAYINEAWSFGTAIPYKHQDRLKICSNGCTAIEKGRLDLSAEAFEAAAREGLEFRLVGRRASVLCKLPPEIFRQVLELQRNGGMSMKEAV